MILLPNLQYSVQICYVLRQGVAKLIHQLIRDRPIYRPIFGFYRYIGIGQNGRYYQPQHELTKHCYIPHASRQLAQESTTKQVKTVILQQCGAEVQLMPSLAQINLKKLA